MEGQITLVDKIIQKIKNNPVYASIIVAGIIIVALAKSTDAVKNIYNSIEKLIISPNISGEWLSETLTNRYDRNDNYRLFFNFEQKNQHLNGSVIQISAQPDGYTVEYTIREGKVEKSKITFYLQKTLNTGPFKQFYSGILTKGQIGFSRQDGPDGDIGKFTVKLRTTTPLHKAALKGDERIVTKLLEKGTNANITDNYNSTPLHTVLRARRALAQKMEEKTKQYQKLYYITAVPLTINSAAFDLG